MNLPDIPVESDETTTQAEYVGTEDVDATHAAEATDDEDGGDEPEDSFRAPVV